METRLGLLGLTGWCDFILAENFFINMTALLAGSGRVFSGSGIWPKYGAGFGKTQNVLTGFGI